ncbi:porin [Labrys sp. 22185]|uniref:porin n=1 Tax=Labrys sp. 22185 TaxID=3453888 RepID=UPI003F8681B5
MTMKSVLLGAAAAIASIGTAQAADLPLTKGEAVEYVKVCSAFGPGFFYIPGSDTCLKIGGEIRADYRVFGGSKAYKFSRDDNRSAFNTQARIWFDARTQTDWGLLRSYFQINADSHKISDTHTYNSNTFSIDKAFIQFGGLTAGYAHSFFGFYDNDYGDTIWAPYYAESNTVNLIAYTAQFGGGFSATLSVEDGRDHRQDKLFNDQGGQQVPDVVGQLRFDQEWGAVAVQGAGHQFRTNGQFADDFGRNRNKYGWAVGGSGLIKLPFIDGGHFVVEGQYANGALDYLGIGNTQIGGQDFFVDSRGQFKGGKGWSIVAELGGNITPQLNANLVGSYIDTKYDNVAGSLGGGKFTVKEFTVAANLAYTVVKGLTISAEAAYTRSDNGDGFDNGKTGSDHVAVEKGKGNIWQGGVRLKRVF